MNGKKKYVAIALVLLVGIGSFVFASPDEEEKGSKPEDSTVEQSGTKDPEKDNTTDEIVDDNEVTNPVINTNPRPTVVDNSYANALAAVLELEKVLTSEQADVAAELVDRVTNQNQKDSLATRVENALNAISATELVEELEDMVANATEKSNLVSALSFRDDSATPAVEKISGTELEEVKEELAKRIEDLKEILEDNEAPTIEAETIEKVVVNEGHYNKDVTVKVSDDAKIIIVTKDDSDYDTKEKYTENGTYKVLAVDEAFNEAELTFTIDKIKPLIKGVEDGAYYNTSVTPIIEEENIQNVVVMKDGNKYTKYKVGNALTEEGTYRMRMTDKAGNKFDYITFVIDTTAATVESVTYTPNTLTNGKVIVTITYSEEIKEVTGWTLTDDKKGIYREFDVNVTDYVTVYDLAGNETKVDYAVTNIDKVEPTVEVNYRNGATWIIGNDNITENLRFVIMKGDTLVDDFYGVDRGVGKSFTIQWHAATYGEGEYTATVYDEAGNSATTTAMVDVTAPTLTITIEEGKTKVTGSDNITENLRYVIMKGNTLVDDFYGNDRGVGNSFNIEGYASTYGDGEYTVTVYDEVENSHTTTAMVDTHAPEYATLRMLGGKSIKENGVQTWYVRANQDINVYMTFKEKLAVNAKVKVNGEELPTTYVKEVDGTYMYMATYRVTENSKQGAVSIEVYGYADKVGNVGKTLTNEDITTPGQKNVSIDTIAPEYATLRMLGGKSIKENGVQTWHVRNGQDINIYMTFKEKLAVNAKVKVNGEELPTTYVKEVDGTYMYMATYRVTENSKQGAVSIEVYGYADKAGNVGKTLTNEDITTPGQKNVSIDSLAPEYATLRMLGGKAVKENGGQTWYVKAGQDINVYMTFKEKLAVNAKVKVNGEELPTTYVKEVDGTYMYMATYRVTENSKQGAVSIEVYGYADEIGNVGKTLTNEHITTPGQKNVLIYLEVSNLEQLKNAISNGASNIHIINTINISENVVISSTNKVNLTVEDNTTMFNVASGYSLTLNNIVLDGGNQYNVDYTIYENMTNDAYAIFDGNTTELTRIFRNAPLIISNGKVVLGKGTLIKNYAHQPVNQYGAGQQYGGPAIVANNGSVVIDGLEFTNNVSQLLTATNTAVTIEDINVHDTWTNGNKAGLIEINSGATMNFNNGTIKNNIMTMRSYGLFIANGGTININGGLFENNYSTKNGGNTAGSLFGVEVSGKIYMNDGTIRNNIGYRAGAFATRWANNDSVIELNGGVISNNTTRNEDFKNASIFVQSKVVIGTNMTIDDKVAIRNGTLENNGTINGDVEVVSGTFNNNGIVTGNIIP